MKRNKAIGFGLAALAAAAMIQAPAFAEGRQTASAVLDQNENELEVTVDLTGGKSVEFARGAVYLYDGPADKDAEAEAIGLTLDREVYEEYLESGSESDSFEKEGSTTKYVDEKGTFILLFEDGDACFMIEAEDEDVFERFEMKAVEEGTGVPESEIFSEDEMNGAMGLILATFLDWNGCELEDLRYAGDEFSTGAELEKINEDEEKYVAVAKFLMDFHSPTEEGDLEGTAWEPDAEYSDYEWILGLKEDGEWEVVDCGY